MYWGDAVAWKCSSSQNKSELKVSGGPQMVEPKKKLLNILLFYNNS